MYTYYSLKNNYLLILWGCPCMSKPPPPDAYSLLGRGPCGETMGGVLIKVQCSTSSLFLLFKHFGAMGSHCRTWWQWKPEQRSLRYLWNMPEQDMDAYLHTLYICIIDDKVSSLLNSNIENANTESATCTNTCMHSYVHTYIHSAHSHT